MAKKKIKQIKQKSATITPEKYMMTKVRSLPVEECLVTKDIMVDGLGSVIIARKHASGKYTAGFFLVDTFCLGVKNCFYEFNIEEDDFLALTDDDLLLDVSYDEAHNIVYGAVAYAEELGIKPHKRFAITQFILEDDTEDVPLIEYEFGKNGKPFLVAINQREANYYSSILKKSVGDDFEFIIDARTELFDEDFFDEYFPDTEELLNYEMRIKKEGQHGMITRRIMRSEDLPHTEYSYKNPEYPKELKIKNKELDVFYLQENVFTLDKENIDRILALPRESLIEDLENIINYEIEYGCSTIDNLQDDAIIISPVYHSIFFLAELRAEEKLSTVLEVMKQDSSFVDHHLGDTAEDIFPLTLYYLGRDKLPQLMDFAKEPGLYIYFKYQVFDTATIILTYEPERREEIINWYNEILTFYLANISDSRYYDATLAGMVMINLLEIKAIELLPVIKKLFETGMVDEGCCGSFEEIEEYMLSDDNYRSEYPLRNIYERYESIEKKWTRLS